MPFAVQRVLLAALRGPAPPSSPSILTLRSPRRRSTSGGGPGGRRRVFRWRGRAPARRRACRSSAGPSAPRQRPPPLRRFKRGASGGTLFDARDERFYAWDARTAGVVDQTGAGDAFSAGLILAHLTGLPVETCLDAPSSRASFAVADWGPEALLAATRTEAEARWRQLYGSEEER